MSASRPRAGYQPALDGVRAVSVVLVLLFHGDVSWMKGGYIGVSVFFTLSGFLITGLLLREIDGRGRVALGRFYARRARRLLPASLLCLAGVVAAWELGWLEGVTQLRRDVLGAATQTANWTSLLGGDSYTTLLAARGGRPSPLAHYWSLAIEEQFYWMWPLALSGLVALAARRRRSGILVQVAAVTAVLAASAPLTALVWGPDAAYWATPARLAEILVGCLLAVWCAERGVPRLPTATAPIALCAIVVTAMLVPSGSGPLYSGAFPVLAVVSAALVAGLQQDGWPARALGLPPLAALGRISYGVYLYHWPVFVVVDTARTGWTGPGLLALRMSVTLALAILSYVLVEAPIRHAELSPRATLVPALGGSLGVALLAVVLVPATTDEYWRAPVATAPVSTLAPGDTVAPLVTTTTAPATQPSTTTVAEPTTTTFPLSPVLPAVERPVRMILVGDSTAVALGNGLVRWAEDHPDAIAPLVLAWPGCGLLTQDNVPSDGDVDFVTECAAILGTRLPEAVRTFQPDVVVLMTYLRDVMPRVWSPDGPEVGPTDPVYRAELTTAYRSFVTGLTATSAAQIVIVRPPDLDPYWFGTDPISLDPERRAVIDDVVADAVAQAPGRASVLDLKAWMEATGLAGDRDLRPDGLHLTTDGGYEVCDRWICPMVMARALGG